MYASHGFSTPASDNNVFRSGWKPLPQDKLTDSQFPSVSQVMLIPAAGAMMNREDHHMFLKVISNALLPDRQVDRQSV